MMNRDQNQDQQNAQNAQSSMGQPGTTGNMGSGQSAQGQSGMSGSQGAQRQTGNVGNAGNAGNAGNMGASGKGQNPMASDQPVEQALSPNPEHLNPNDPNVARDPVCGMLVDKRTAPDTIAPAVGTSGPRLYFCSAACKKIFEDNPQRFGYNNY